MRAAGATRFVAIVKEDVENQVEEFRSGFWNSGEVFLDEQQAFNKALGGGEVWKPIEGIEAFMAMMSDPDSPIRTKEHVKKTVEEGIAGNTIGEGFIVGGVYVIRSDGTPAYSFLEEQVGDAAPLDDVVQGVKDAVVPLTDRCRVYQDITKTIGQTPIVKVNRLAPEGVNLYVKLEYFNPLSSVKDRLALAIIEDAEKSGALKPGGTVVEATSGNTGIALAMVCAQRGYGFVAVMAASFSVERRKVMRALGAKVVVTPAPLGGTGMVKKAEELAETHKWFPARQFETEANAAFHKKTTGPEIMAAFEREGLRLDYWVSGYGTGGTFSGAGEYIKSTSPSTKIVLSEPAAAPLVSSGTPQERKEGGGPAKGHPSFKAHPIQGWAPNFIPLVCEEGLKKNIMDDLVAVEGKDAMATALLLARKEGIFCGTSGGATVWAALEVCKKAPKGSNILAMVPDTAERYLSTPLFESISAEMSAEEEELFRSTPTGHERPLQ